MVVHEKVKITIETNDGEKLVNSEDVQVSYRKYKTEYGSAKNVVRIHNLHWVEPLAPEELEAELKKKGLA